VFLHRRDAVFRTAREIVGYFLGRIR
jgi:hypothetical protein